MNTVTEQDAYLAAVRAALADLDPAVRDELLEDLPQHLAEVAAEGGSLTDRLGPPEAYAAELRAAVGVPRATGARGLDERVAGTVRAVRARLGVADRRLGPVIGYGRASEFLRLLRPAWWVLRGYLVAMAVTVVTTTEFGLLPRLGGSTIAAVLLLAVCVPASVWLGRRERSFPAWPRRAVAAGGLVLVVFGLAGFVDADRRGNYLDNTQSVSVDPYHYIEDVYVYDENGQLVTGATLYDQDGNPIRLGDLYRCSDAYRTGHDGTSVRDAVRGLDVEPAGYPYCPQFAPYQIAPRPGVRPTLAPAPTTVPAQPTATPDPAVPSPTAEPTVTPVPTPSGAAAPSPTG